jgi:hypothetical protein
MEESKQVEEASKQEEYAQNDLNREQFEFVVLGSGLTENILGA